mgnify:CR=1 FL=1
MNHKENRRVKITKQVLKDSLLELLETESIHKISIRTLCENADINRSTFYKYYGSQYDLLKEMEDDLLTKIEENLSGEETTTLRRMEQVLIYAKSNMKLCKLLLNSNVDADFPKRLLNHPAIIAKMEHMISSAGDPVSISYLYDCVLYGGYQMIKRWVNEDCQIAPKHMAHIIDHTFQKLLV